MARQVVTQIIDDLDGTADAAEVSFAFAGIEYSIDLSQGNRDEFAKAIQPYIDAARTTNRSRRSRAATKGTSDRRDLKAVREWAKKRGIEVSDRGRVPAAVVAQYDAAQS